MLFIAHRGNTEGPNSELENNPDYIIDAQLYGFDVEVDVWLLENGIYLGHDRPDHHVNESFLLRDGLWCHAKNIQALFMLRKIGAHCFWHDNDVATLTSKGYIWTFPGNPISDLSIAVMPEKVNTNWMNGYGVCSDYVKKFNNDYRS